MAPWLPDRWRRLSSEPRDCLLLSQRSDPRLLPWGTVLCPTHRLTPAAGFPELTPAALQTHPRLPRSLIHCSGGDSSRAVPVTNNRHPEEARELPSAQELSWRRNPFHKALCRGRGGSDTRGNRPSGPGRALGWVPRGLWWGQDLSTLALSSPAAHHPAHGGSFLARGKTRRWVPGHVPDVVTKRKERHGCRHGPDPALSPALLLSGFSAPGKLLNLSESVSSPGK